MVGRFIVKVVPVNLEDLPAGSRWRGARFHWLWSSVPERSGDRCLAGKSFPMVIGRSAEAALSNET